MQSGFLRVAQTDNTRNGFHSSLSVLQQRGIGICRMVFGFTWAFAAVLKWQPAFVQSFDKVVGGAKDGQPAAIQAWIGLWVNIVHINPTFFGSVAALVETLLALCFLLGIFNNTAAVVGIVWSLTIWSVANGFGGPYVAGQSTDIGTAFPYALISALLLCVCAGRYLGLDRELTPHLGRFGFLASGSLKRRSE